MCCGRTDCTPCLCCFADVRESCYFPLPESPPFSHMHCLFPSRSLHCLFLPSASPTILFERTASLPALSNPYPCHSFFSAAPSLTHLLADRLPEVCMQWDCKDCEGRFVLVLVLIGWLFTCVVDFLPSLSLFCAWNKAQHVQGI